MATPTSGAIAVPAGTALVRAGIGEASAPPPPPPPPPATQTWYRLSRENPLLFQPVAAASIPPRVFGGLSYNRDIYGPTGFYVGLESGIRWDVRGVDHIDASLQRQGNTPWASASASVGTVSLDVAVAVNYCTADNRWAAFKLSGPSGVLLRGPFSASPPRLDVVYQGGGSASLACRTMATVPATDNANNKGTRVAAVMALPVVVEFDRPSGLVSSATLVLEVSSGSGTISVMVVDPPQPTLPAQSGRAYLYDALDVGLAADPDSVFVHRYMDGGALTDWAIFQADLPSGMTNSVNIVSNYDPGIYGLGSTNTQRYPHVGQGKWVGLPEPGNPKSKVEFVPSTHTAHGFEPLVAGMGALKVTMYAGRDTATGQPLTDGSIVGYSASVATDARLMLPEPTFGIEDELYCRHYMRIGRTAQPTLTNRLQVYRSYPDDLVWTVIGGKLGIMPAHPTTRGGVSQTSGGPFGWQARLGWNECDEPEGPETTSWRGGVHLFDFAGNNPPGFSHGSSPGYDQRTGQINGGFGSHFAVNRWYCVEGRVRLNGVTDTYPGYADSNGLIEVWVDGRKVYSKGGLVLRTAPAYSGFRAHVRTTALGPDQTAQVALYGASAGKGYAGLVLRHSGLVAPVPGWFYGYCVFVSRISAGLVKVVLVKRTNHRLWTASNLIVQSAWADGDILSAEATGTAPTTVVVKRNGSTLITYVDAADANHLGSYAGVFGTANDGTDGWRLGDWSAGDGVTTLTEDWSGLSDGLLPDGAWRACDEYGVGQVNSGKLWFPPSGAAMNRLNPSLAIPPTRDVGIRELWWNWFHGGTEQTSIERHLFITGVAVSRSYIGPMKFA